MGVALWLGKFLQEPIQVIEYLIFMAIATAVSGFFVIRFDQDIKSQTSNSQRDSSLSLMKYWAWWLSVLLFQIGFGGFYNFFTIYETSHGISLEMTSWLWSFGVVCEIVMFYFQGRLLERFGLLNLISFSIFTATIRWILLWLYPNSLLIALLSQSLHSLNFALYYSASIAYIYQLYTQKKLAQQFFLGIGFGLGGSLGAFIAGLVNQYDKNLLFLSQAIIVFLAYIAILIHKRRVGV
jgi:PPP family 3-phenylpropionic acid transporter